MKIYMVYIIGWLGMVILAILNGALRVNTYSAHMDELSAHQLSTLTALLVFSLYIRILTGIFRLETGRQALMIGGIWLLLTTGFEFIFGHYVMGHDWRRLFHDYNLLQGRIWILVLIWTFLAPYLCFKLRS